MTAAPAEVAVAKSAVAVKGQCDKRTAQDLTREIKRSLEQSWRLLKEAFERRAWAALGYDSWDSYCTEELGTGLGRLSKELRSEAVAELTSGERPMSNRAIAVAIGVDEGTVWNDLRAGAEISVPDPTEEVKPRTEPCDKQPQREPVEEQRQLGPVEGDEWQHEAAEPEQLQLEPAEDKECNGSNRPGPAVTGVDGRSYATQPESRSRRRPIADTFLRAAVRLDKDAQGLVRLTEDDRFRTHAAVLGGRADIERAADAIRTVLDALADAGNG